MKRAMKRAKAPKAKPRPPAAQLEIIDGIDLQTFPLFCGSVPRVNDSPFNPRPTEKRPAVDLFGNPTRPTLEEMQRRANQ